MDLRLYISVLWRFRILVLIGTLLAIMLTLMSFARLSFDGGAPKLAYRESETWNASGAIFITQEGFALGRSVYDEVLPIERGGDVEFVPRLSDPSRFAAYANLYARLATSDELTERMLRDGPLEGQVTAGAPSIEGNSSILLPIVNVGALAASPEAAIETANRAVKALQDHVRERQDANGIKPDRRVVLQVLNRPQGAILVEGRSITRPGAIFVAVMFAVLALAFVLDNLRPRMRPQLVEADATGAQRARRSA
jgi:hypothetical protein